MSTLNKSAVVVLALCFLAGSLAAQPYLNIQPKPPQDLASRSATLEDVAKFAWQEFLALNWKASIDSTHPPSASNPRGTPDLTWNPSKLVPKFPNPLVWQTYAQTTEFRPNVPLTTPWVNLSFPKYSYSNTVAIGSGSFQLWNNLDEDNEIGSCDIYAQYPTQKTPRDLVLFQVKVNRDEYEYLRTNFGATQNLPVVGANGVVPPCPLNALLCNTQAQVAKNIKNKNTTPPYAYYPGQTSTCGPCPAGQAICLPCGAAGGAEGAIEVKSAWRRLLKGDDPSHFYTTTAIYYDINKAGKIAYYNDTFALVGMHIIHKTVNFPDFVFATFEQVDVEKSNSYYVTLDQATKPPSETGTPTPIQRQVGTQTSRTQLHPVPKALDDVTSQVRKQLIDMNPSSVWQYYRLTGVYGASTDCPVNLNGVPESSKACIAAQNSIAAQCTATTTNNPNYYMANFMVESDPGLNNFSGPGFAQSIFGSCQNTVYANKIYNNGGCKGCHGVAQTAFGTDFSFLLDFGNNKPSIQPATIRYVPPTTASPKIKLKHYLDLVKTLQP